MRQDHEPEYEALLAEELTSEEVRELLERLNAQDMGGSENATVAGVMEASGCEATVVGRLLAEIRKEDFEEKLGQALKQHEQRIGTLESRTVPSAHVPPVTTPPQIHYDAATKAAIAQQDAIRIKDQQRLFIVFAIVIVVVGLMLFISSLFHQTPPGQPYLGPVDAGRMERLPNGRIIVRVAADGSVRMSTQAEREKYGIYQEQPEKMNWEDRKLAKETAQ